MVDRSGVGFQPTTEAQYITVKAKRRRKHEAYPAVDPRGIGTLVVDPRKIDSRVKNDEGRFCMVVLYRTVRSASVRVIGSVTSPILPR